MKSSGTLPEDPRWIKLMERYSGDITAFSIEVRGQIPSMQQIDLFSSVAMSRSRTSVASGHGCFGIGTEIMLSDGSIKPAEDIAVGDKLMGDDGISIRNVLALISGNEELYRVIYSDGKSHIFNESHMLCLVNQSTKEKWKPTIKHWLNGAFSDHLSYRLIGDNRYEMISIVAVERLGVGCYYGFELDGNGQFLGGDGTVLSNTGKTTALATIIWWHLVCHEQSVTLVTANDMDQLKATLWKEIGLAQEQIRRGIHGWIADYVEILANNTMRVIGFEDTWFVESKTANEKTANKMAGRHGKWLLVIGDEASTLPDTVCSTLAGALTEEHNRMILTSQYTRAAGYFHNTQTSLSRRNGGTWNNLTFNSFDSPHVSNEALLELWNAYDDDERRVRILGLPPMDSSKHMMNMRTAEAMYQRGRIIRDDEHYGWFVLGDIASGEGLRDKSAILVARVIGYGDTGIDARRVEIVEIPVHTNHIRSNVLANYMMDAGANLSNVTYLPDAGGLGVNVCQDIEDAGKVITRVIWGKACFVGRNVERYVNQRAQAMHHAARAAKEGRLSFLTTDYRGIVIGQASRIPKNFSGNKGKMVVPPKGSKEWDGLPSPDLWDAVCFAFLENAQYMVAEKTGVTAGATASVAATVADMYDDL